MGEQLSPTPNPLDTEMLGDRSLQAWHQWLCTDQATGEPTGQLAVPASRYGRNGSDCAWFAIAVECVYLHANGESDNPEGAMDVSLGWAVNDSDFIEPFLREYEYAIPDALKRELGDFFTRGAGDVS